LGLSLDSSDLHKLETIRDAVLTTLSSEQRTLDRLASETATALADSAFLSQDIATQQRHAEKIRAALGADWLEIFVGGKPLLLASSEFSIPLPKAGFPVRIAGSGPFSYRGYLFSQSRLMAPASATLCLARLPASDKISPDFFCIFDKSGILFKRGSVPEFKVLQEMASQDVTHQFQAGEDLYRTRIFKAGDGFNILTGYPAQRATLSRSLVDQLMMRLALLEVLGLLLLGFFLGRRLFAPLGALKQSLEQVAEGRWKEIPLDKPPIQNSGAEVENVVHSFNRMVRELSSAQTRLLDVQKELAKKDKMAALGRFSAGIAHEINNPLGTILVTAGMLKEAAQAGRKLAPEDFDAILDEVRRCRDIIATLRTYTGRTQPQLVRMAFSEFFAAISSYLSNESGFKSLQFGFSSPPDEDMAIMVDVKAMYQVFHNLVKNAFEAMSDMPVKKIDLSAEAAEDHFCIRVHDYGRGFTCLPEHIFEPLFTTKPQGTGLGLIICQAIIDGHHGRIEARRLEEAGITEFSIMLPFARLQKQEN
ncbi:MAG TPA: HAMP domain-containing sensor histidine kinase, partial [Candidatus Rifleibacterium sp.]|nr:HAMP domain-containing sensor histidine kinase [Candidatus Rifleibacterium sp.]